MLNFTKRGFTNVTGLAKDSDGVWRGTAIQAGKSVKVSVDFQGNVVVGPLGFAIPPSDTGKEIKT
jgi:hypothetical protein